MDMKVKSLSFKFGGMQIRTQTSDVCVECLGIFNPQYNVFKIRNFN